MRFNRPIRQRRVKPSRHVQAAPAAVVLTPVQQTPQQDAGQIEEKQQSWLFHLFAPRNIIIAFFTLSIFMIEFIEMWEIGIPRTVAFSGLDMISSSVANVPVLILAILAACGLIVMVLLVISLGAYGVVGVVSVLLNVLALAFQVVRACFHSVRRLVELLREHAGAGHPVLRVIARGMLAWLREAPAHWRLVERSLPGRIIAGASALYAWFRARAAWVFGEATTIAKDRQDLFSWRHLVQLGVTVCTFGLVIRFALLAATDYDRRLREDIPVLGECQFVAAGGPTIGQTALGLIGIGAGATDGQGSIWSVFQPLNTGYVVLDKGFRTTSVLAATPPALPDTASAAAPASPLDRTARCVAYVGDYGDWAYLVPLDLTGEREGFLIRRSLIKEFSPFPPMPEPRTRIVTGPPVGKDDVTAAPLDDIAQALRALQVPLVALAEDAGTTTVTPADLVLLEQRLDTEAAKGAAARDTLDRSVARVDAAVGVLDARVDQAERAGGSLALRTERLEASDTAQTDALGEMRAWTAAHEAAAGPGPIAPAGDAIDALETRLRDVDLRLVSLDARVAAFPGADGEVVALTTLVNELQARVEELQRLLVKPPVTPRPPFGAGFTIDGPYGAMPTRQIDALDHAWRSADGLRACIERHTRAAHIGFARNSAEIRDQAGVAAVEALLDEMLPSDRSPAVVFVRGGADSLGTPDVNRRMSERRAAAVQRWIEDYLGDDRLDEGIEIVSYGIGENVGLLDPANTAGARSVSVFVCGLGDARAALD